MDRKYPALVGLDQNYIIGLATAAVASHRGESISSPWDEMLRELYARVQVSQEIACPTSPFTIDESRRGENVIARNEAISTEMSGGYEFRPWSEAMRFQAANRMRAISGRTAAYQRPPTTSNDPYLFLVQQRSVRENGLDNLCFRVNWAVEHDKRTGRDMDAVRRHRALDWAIEMDARMITATPRANSFVEQFLRDAVEFRIIYDAWTGDDADKANDRLIPTYQAMYPGAAYVPLPEMDGIGPKLPWQHPNPRYVDNDFIRVVRSELPLLPTPDIWGRLMTEIARDRLRTGGERSGNDVYDIIRAATAIPVVKAYATDGGIAGLLDRSGIAAEYAVSVYSARRDDPHRFLQDLAALATSQ